MTFTDIIITFTVLMGIFIIVYSKVKDQALGDTFDEIKDMINPVNIQEGMMP